MRREGLSGRSGWPRGDRDAWVAFRAARATRVDRVYGRLERELGRFARGPA
jgi:hypothetical protein